MGFIRQQEEKLALQYIIWSYQKNKYPMPDAAKLRQMASKLVDDAHQIARERGSNVLTIIKELVQDIATKKKSG